MIYGYARVSTNEQNLDLQNDALREAGCAEIFRDKVSGGSKKKQQLDALRLRMKAGDVLVVWRLDRLGRSLLPLLDLIQALQLEGIGFRTLQEGIDTTTQSGKLMFNIFAVLSEFERGLIRERTLAGLDAARKRGRIGGRPPKLSQVQSLKAKELREIGRTLRSIAKQFKVTLPTIRKALKA